jgi:hypothetical protein
MDDGVSAAATYGVAMPPASHDLSGSAGQPSRPRIYEDLRRRNARRAEIARARAMRVRIDRAVQIARERRFLGRG